MWYSPKKVVLPLFVVICFVLSLHFTDGKTSIVIRQLGLRDGIYAQSYVHGAPIEKFRAQAGGGRAVRDVWKLRARRENSIKNYAGRYKNWSPYKEKQRFSINDGPPFTKRRRPVPAHRLKYRENDVFYPRRPVRPQKHKVNNLERPNPTYDDLDSDDFFPEETKRAEAQYEYGFRSSVKKGRFPYERRKKPKKSQSKPTYDEDDRRIVFGDERKSHFVVERPEGVRKIPKRQPSVSYSTFIQHPQGASEADYDYADEEDTRPYRKKKRRIKKKTNKQREEEEVEDYSRTPQNYRYSTQDEEFETDLRSKPKKYKNEPQPVYGEGHISHHTPSYASPNVYRPQEDYLSPVQSSQKVQTFNNPPQIQSITNPYKSSYESSSFSQPIQFNKITQPSQDYIYHGNSGNYVPGTYTSVSTYDSSIPSTSNPYQKYKNYQEQSVYYSPSLSYQKDISSSYKTSPNYDSTDTFKDFNSNANNQKKYSSYSSKYSEGSGVFSSVQYSEKPDQDNDFLQKHQNLYNNGINGVPVQGDGYTSKGGKKDYDIGYGEFQFDENPV